MKKYTEESEEKANLNDWPLNAADANQDDKDLEDTDDDNEDEDEGSGDWGDVDPAGGPAPSAPGSAV